MSRTRPVPLWCEVLPALDLCHRTGHLDGGGQNVSYFAGEIVTGGLAPADGDLELARLDHPPSLTINQRELARCQSESEPFHLSGGEMNSLKSLKLPDGHRHRRGSVAHI